MSYARVLCEPPWRGCPLVLEGGAVVPTLTEYVGYEHVEQLCRLLYIMFAFSAVSLVCWVLSIKQLLIQLAVLSRRYPRSRQPLISR